MHRPQENLVLEEVGEGREHGPCRPGAAMTVTVPLGGRGGEL